MDRILVALLSPGALLLGNAGARFEELGLGIVAAVAVELEGVAPAARPPSRRDEQRVARVVRRIEAQAEQRLPLSDLARDAEMSPYRFLRMFSRVVVMTPHWYVLHTRLHRAAVRLRSSEEPISAIAFDAGFEDRSTFHRRFRRLMGSNPGTYRRMARRAEESHSASTAWPRGVRWRSSR